MSIYKVVCKNCKQSDLIDILEDTKILWDHNTYIVSGRKRLDSQWGWQCLCGNNDILTDQEDRVITDKVNPDPKEIHKVISNLIVQKSKFAMEKV